MRATIAMIFSLLLAQSCGYKTKEVDNHFECAYYQYDRFTTNELGVEELEADDETTILSENELGPDRIEVEVQLCVYEDQDNDVVEPSITGSRG